VTIHKGEPGDPGARKHGRIEDLENIKPHPRTISEAIPPPPVAPKPQTARAVPGVVPGVKSP